MQKKVRKVTIALVAGVMAMSIDMQSHNGANCCSGLPTIPGASQFTTVHGILLATLSQFIFGPALQVWNNWGAAQIEKKLLTPKEIAKRKSKCCGDAKAPDPVMQEIEIAVDQKGVVRSVQQQNPATCQTCSCTDHACKSAQEEKK